MLVLISMSVIAVLGLAVGAVLAKVSPEEMKPGKKYFSFLRKLMLTAFLVVLALYSNGMWQYILIGLVIGFFIRLNYLYFGLAMASASGNLLFLVAALIFLYGIPTGSLMVEKSVFRPLVILITLIAFFLPFLLKLITLSSPVVMSLCLGAMMHAMYSKFMEGRLNSLSM